MTLTGAGMEREAELCCGLVCPEELMSRVSQDRERRSCVVIFVPGNEGGSTLGWKTEVSLGSTRDSADHETAVYSILKQDEDALTRRSARMAA